MSKREQLGSDADLSGRVAIVTGATRGMGFHIASDLAHRGAKVYIAARTTAAAEEVIARIGKLHQVSRISEDRHSVSKASKEVESSTQLQLRTLEVDLRSLSSAQRAAEMFLEHETGLHILIHNAAAMAKTYELTEDGLEDTFVVNYLAPFVFTRTLIKTLVLSSRTTDVRIILLSSVMHNLAPATGSLSSREEINSDCLPHGTPADQRDSGKSMIRRYARSKLALILFARELQQHFDRAGSPALVVALHPGAVKTPSCLSTLRRTFGIIIGTLFSAVVALFGKSPANGAKLALWAASAPGLNEREELRGAYVVCGSNGGGKVGTLGSAEAGDAVLAKALWKVSDEIADTMLAKPLHLAAEAGSMKEDRSDKGEETDEADEADEQR